MALLELGDTLFTIILVLAIILIFAKGVVIVQPYQQALEVRLGQYRGPLNPGFRWVIPFITGIIKVDLRTQVMDVPRQEVITKDNSPTNVDAIVYVRVIDPEKSAFEVANFRMATVALAQTTLRGVIGDMELDEILYNRDLINTRLRDILDRETDQWGVKVERVEIKEVDPVGAVKQAMTEQTAAERERRAAILRADGEKRSAILTAEGKRQSMILEAEGERQSRILRAEGDRKSRILQAQGEAQGLRILSLGSRALDRKAITVLSLNALKQMSDGQATKIIFPFELSGLIKQSAKFLGEEAEVLVDEDWRDVTLDESILGKSPADENVDDATEYVKEIEKKIKTLEDPTTPVSLESSIDSPDILGTGKE
jgi:regulator of protease activity HflC (stomatin/prohibitin superfamily)